MKIIICNLSGNVGKTTLAAMFLAPRLPGYEVVALETLNAGSVLLKAVIIDAKNFEDVFAPIVSNPNILIDVGASNIEATIKGLLAYEGLYSEINYFLLPTVPEDKQQTDTWKMVEILAAQGVERERIKIILNRARTAILEEVERDFNIIFEYAKKTQRCLVDAVVAIPDSPLFEQLEEVKMNLDEILELDESALRKEIAHRTPEREKALRMLSLQMRAKSIKTVLDTVFQALELS